MVYDSRFFFFTLQILTASGFGLKILFPKASITPWSRPVKLLSSTVPFLSVDHHLISSKRERAEGMDGGQETRPDLSGAGMTAQARASATKRKYMFSMGWRGWNAYHCRVGTIVIT